MTEKALYQQISVALVIGVATVVNIFFGIVIMVKGWDVEPQSYPWIIGGGLFVSFMAWMLAASIRLIYGDKKDE